MMPLPSLRPRSEQNQWYWMVMCMDLGVRRGGSVVASCLAARLSLKTVLMVEFRSPYSGIQPNTFDVAANCYRLILGDKILLSPSLISMKWVVPLMLPMQPISKYDDLSLDVLQKQQLPGRVAFSYLWQPAPPKLSSMPLWPLWMQHVQKIQCKAERTLKECDDVLKKPERTEFAFYTSILLDQLYPLSHWSL